MTPDCVGREAVSWGGATGPRLVLFVNGARDGLG